jgi:CHAT domain-containing protein/tetratricopeptide (TPR) repeat protein
MTLPLAQRLALAAGERPGEGVGMKVRGWLVALLLGWAGEGLDVRAAAPPARKPTPKERAALWKEHAALVARAKGLIRAARWKEAIGPVRAALGLQRRLLGNQHARVQETLGVLKGVLERAGEARLARETQAELVAVLTRRYGGGHWRAADARWELKDMALRSRLSPAQRGKLAQAERLEERVFNLWRQGKPKDALPLARRTLALRTEVLGQRHVLVALSLFNLAVQHQALGDQGRARPLFERARDLYKALLGEGHPSHAMTLENLGMVYQALGDHGQALPLFERARDIRKAALGEKHPSYAHSLDNLADLYRDMGDYGRARALYEQARAIYKAKLGQWNASYATVLNSLGVLHYKQGDYGRARTLLVQALAIRKVVQGPKHPDYGRCLNNLALLYHALEDFARARPLYEQARDIARAELGPRHPSYAITLENLATLDQDMGEYGRALPLLERALEIHEAALGEKHPLYARSLNALAGLNALRGKPDEALRRARTALAVQQTHLENTFTVLSTRQRLELLNSLRFSLDVRLSLGGVAKEPAGRRYEAVLAWKGVTASRHVEERLAGDRPALQPLVRRLREARAGLARLSAIPPTPAGLEGWRRRFADLERRKDDLEARLARQSAPFRVLHQRRNLRHAEAAAALPPRTALIDFLVYEHWQPSRTTKGAFTTEGRLLAFLLTGPKKGPVCVDLGPAAPLERLVEAWRRPLTTERPTPPDPRVAAALRRGLWQRLERHLGGARTVLIAPDGFLCGLPFAALPGKKPGTYLLEEVSIGYVGSGRHLLEMADKQEKSGAGLLAVGDLAYGKAARRREVDAFAGRFLPWEVLPATRPELDRLSALYRSAFPRRRAPRLLTGSKGDKTALLSALQPEEEGRRWRYLHLATHGYFEPPRNAVPLPALACWAAGVGSAPRCGPLLALAALHAAEDPEAKDRSRTSFDLSGQRARTFERNPLLICGLVLAGANKSPDGLLSAEEVSSLDLRGCELAVLSACETGLGKVAGGQGVLGLQRAFQSAGARATLTSLWSVSDAATSVLMEQFYKNLWQKKMSKLEALRQAQFTVLRNPRLVEARHKLLLAEWKKKHPKGKALALRGPARVAVVLPGGKDNPKARAERTNPAHGAAFVLCGDGR